MNPENLKAKLPEFKSLLEELEDEPIYSGSYLTKEPGVLLDFIQKRKSRAQMLLKRYVGTDSEYYKEIASFDSSNLSKGLHSQEGISVITQMRAKLIAVLSTLIEETEIFDSIKEPVGGISGKVISSREVFIVHGHDDSLKLATQNVITALGLEPIILHEQPGKGRAIIQKFEDHSDVRFAIVLLTPDDEYYLENKTDSACVKRARANVIFEFGFFVGKVTRSRVAVIYRKDSEFEMLSDYGGVEYIEFDEKGTWKFELVQELKAAGYAVDANKLLKQ